MLKSAVIGYAVGFLALYLTHGASFYAFCHHTSGSHVYPFFRSISRMCEILPMAGMLCGAYGGYRAIHPSRDLLSQGADRILYDFKLVRPSLSRAAQQTEMDRVLKRWLGQYRRSMIVRRLSVLALALLVPTRTWQGAVIFVVVLGYILYTTVNLVLATRHGLQQIRAQWGDDVVDRQQPLPRTLR